MQEMQSWLEFLPFGIGSIMAVGSSKVEMSCTEASGTVAVTKERGTLAYQVLQRQVSQLTTRNVAGVYANIGTTKLKWPSLGAR